MDFKGFVVTLIWLSISCMYVACPVLVIVLVISVLIGPRGKVVPPPPKKTNLDQP